MFSRLLSQVSGTRRPRYPSAILALEGPQYMNVLHIIPETRETEKFGMSHPSRSTFYCDGTKEVHREYLGSVVLYIGDGEDQTTLLDEISRRAIAYLNKHSEFASGKDANRTVQLIELAFRNVVCELLEQKKGRSPPRNAAQEYPIFIIQVDRPKPGSIMSLNLTSFPRTW